jgi:DNA-binding NtrC family response regulator
VAKPGLLETAEGGSVFLDELGDMPAAVQTKLLRVLEERKVTRVGGLKARELDVRFISATHKDLEAESARGSFRADLYYRLNVIPIRLPPLRERRDDIPLLVSHFLRKCRPDQPDPTQAITKEAMQTLVEYDWPGNVRELENIIERSVILQEGTVLEASDLPDGVRHRRSGPHRRLFEHTSVTLEELEKEYLVTVLNETGWQKKKASSILGINASTLYRKIQRYGLDKEGSSDG